MLRSGDYAGAEQAAVELLQRADVEVDELRDLVTESWRQHAPPDLLAAFDTDR